jgi:hypothetical protein
VSRMPARAMITGGGWVFVAGGGRVMGCGCCGVWSVELVVLQWFSSQRAAITHRRDMEALSMMMHLLLPPAQDKHYTCCTPLYTLQYIFCFHLHLVNHVHSRI